METVTSELRAGPTTFAYKSCGCASKELVGRTHRRRSSQKPVRPDRQHFSCAMSNFPGFRLLGSLLCLSLATSLVAYKNGASVNLSKCLNVSEHLMMECNKALKNWQGGFICKLENTYILPSENENEKKIFSACMAEKKPESCWAGEKNAINETLCRETIHTLLMPFAEKFKSVPKLLAALNDMMQVLNINNITVEEAPDKSPGFYSKDLKRCKSLLILQQFTEIIHRTISYLMVD